MTTKTKRRKVRPPVPEPDFPFERLRAHLIKLPQLEVLFDTWHPFAFNLEGVHFQIKPEETKVRVAFVAVKKAERGTGLFHKAFSAFLEICDHLKIDIVAGAWLTTIINEKFYDKSYWRYRTIYTKHGYCLPDPTPNMKANRVWAERLCTKYYFIITDNDNLALKRTHRR